MATNIWNTLGFRKNPFNIVPDKDTDDLIWAGFKSTKDEFIGLMRTSLSNQESRVVLNISRFGGGKTHASYFFARHAAAYGTTGGEAPLHLIVTAPKSGDNAFWHLYVKLIESITFKTVTTALSRQRANMGDQIALEWLQQVAKSEDLGRLIWNLADPNEDVAFLAGEVLISGKASATARKKLRIRRGVETNSDASQILSALINVLAGYGSEGVLARQRRIFVWLDELESLVYYSSRHYRPFTQAIRELIDCTPKHLTVVMNFSFSDPREAENLEIVIGEALLDRVTDRIVFEEGSPEESLEYLKDLLTHYKSNSSSDRPALFPFSATGAVKMLELAPFRTGKPRTPRRINQWSQHAIQSALNVGMIPETGIDESFISSLPFKDEAGEDTDSV